MDEAASITPLAPLVLDRVTQEEALRLRFRPLALLSGAAAARAIVAGAALPLAGGPLALSMVECLLRRGDGIAAGPAAVTQLQAWSTHQGERAAEAIRSGLDRLCAKRPRWAGFALDRPLIMGILNVTPDSFSDGGAFLAPETAVARGRALLAAGADLLDIGGESTRPGAAPVAPEEEWRRIEPVLRPLAAAGVPISVDTRHALVMAQALAAGARIVNDVTALAGEAASFGIVAQAGAAAILMHMQGEPQTMQHTPQYSLPSLDILEALEARVAVCEAAGIPRDRLAIDPGIGFGKAPRHNLEILARLALFHGLGCAVAIGVSRKSLVGRLTGAQVEERLPGSLAGALYALGQGVQILRVHDVAETRQAVTFWQAIAGSG
jgi:dihydropteroate synthase